MNEVPGWGEHRSVPGGGKAGICQQGYCCGGCRWEPLPEPPAVLRPRGKGPLETVCVWGGRNPWGWFAFSIGALCKQNLSIVSMIRTSVFDF